MSIYALLMWTIMESKMRESAWPSSHRDPPSQKQQQPGPPIRPPGNSAKHPDQWTRHRHRSPPRQRAVSAIPAVSTADHQKRNLSIWQLSSCHILINATPPNRTTFTPQKFVLLLMICTYLDSCFFFFLPSTYNGYQWLPLLSLVHFCSLIA